MRGTRVARCQLPVSGKASCAIIDRWLERLKDTESGSTAGGVGRPLLHLGTQQSSPHFRAPRTDSLFTRPDGSAAGKSDMRGTLCAVPGSPKWSGRLTWQFVLLFGCASLKAVRTGSVYCVRVQGRASGLLTEPFPHQSVSSRRETPVVPAYGSAFGHRGWDELMANGPPSRSIE